MCEDVEWADLSAELAHLHGHDPKPVRRRVRRWLRTKSLKTTHEHAVIYDPASGRIQTGTNARPGQVDFTPEHHLGAALPDDDPHHRAGREPVGA